ncbi:MAG TPA: cytochrome c peroxidase [Bacteroidia bacterium]|jgi:cytochrome c peroxidase|nr:cytochrome c peroxidase [Bacteroidia bacterium]
MKTVSKISFLVLPIVIGGYIFLSSYTGKTNGEIPLVIPKGWPKPVYNTAKNPVTTEGFSLGKKLFYDPLLSKDSTISCSSCHLQYTNYTHVDHSLSHGIRGLKGTRNTLSIINVAWSKTFMWDGGINNIEVQPLAPITNPVEMDNTLENIVIKLRGSEYYRNKFKLAFGDSAEITGQRVLKALSQFMVSIQSYNSKYDKVMRKEKGCEFTEAEKKGLRLFRKNCASCHTEPLFTNNSYEDNGLEIDPVLKDGGRIRITHNKKDSLAFKVPSLRNVEVSSPYMHDGRFRNLEMVLFHYTSGITKDRTVSEKLRKPIVMEEDDKRNLIAFLKTLTDRDFLYDKRFRYSAE